MTMSLARTFESRISALLGGAQRNGAMVVVLAVIPIRPCNLMPSRTPGVSEQMQPSKQEPAPVRVLVGSTNPKVQRRPATIPEEVTVRALDAMRSSFMRCYMRSLEVDPTLGAIKVLLRLQISENGDVVSARSEASDAKLAGCVSIVARGMTFPVTGQAATVDVPLFFQR